jgi:hypothetical protein
MFYYNTVANRQKNICVNLKANNVRNVKKSPYKSKLQPKIPYLLEVS